MDRRDFLAASASTLALAGGVPLPSFDPGYRGHYGGWFCPCHGSDYDTSGRIRSGPAPKNLFVAPYTYLTDHSIRIG